MGYWILIGVILLLLFIILLVYAGTTIYTTDAPETSSYIPNYEISIAPSTSEINQYRSEYGYLSENPQYYGVINSIPSFRLESLIAASNDSDIIGVINSNFEYSLLLYKSHICNYEEEISRNIASTAKIEKVSPKLEEILKLSHYGVPLKNGYPIYVQNMCLFDAIVYEKGQYPWTDDQIILPSTISPTKEGTKSKIPKIIHHTFETSVVPKPLAQCVQQWKNLNPEYTIRYWTSKERRNLIRDNFDSSVLLAYDTLYPGAFKADLWRCCAIYIHGGVYADIKLFPLRGLNTVIEDEDDVILTLDYRTYGIIERYWYNAFFAFPPRHELVKRVIDRIVDNVARRMVPVGPIRILDITGPGVWRDVIRIMTHRDHSEGTFEYSDLGRTKILGHNFNFGQPHTVVNGKAEHIMLAQPPRHLPSVNYWNITGKRRYDDSKIYS